MGTINVEDGAGYSEDKGMDSGAGKRGTVTNPNSGPASFGADGGEASVPADSTAGMRGLAGQGSVDGAQPVGTGPGARGGEEAAIPSDTTDTSLYADQRGKNAAKRS